MIIGTDPVIKIRTDPVIKIRTDPVIKKGWTSCYFMLFIGLFGNNS